MGSESRLEGTVPVAEPVLEKEAAYVVAVKDTTL